MTMIKIGEWNDLIVKREKEFGVYLGCADSDSEVLLPRKQVPNGIFLEQYTMFLRLHRRSWWLTLRYRALCLPEEEVLYTEWTE